ncbi:DUF4190 domain-containing protein [Streptomyces sp. NPDC001315]|uniref:DUF4190 domain-containing protein n=1 Tax=Streptomyces sp. NPDC001315 TaxID=3364562 RepID=UPI003680261E
MSDDAQTPEAPENAAAHRPAPTGDAAPPVSFGKEPADTESADRVSFDKGTAPRAPSVRDTASETAGASPWAPPADAAPGDGPGHTIASGVPITSGGSPAPAPPSVHHQQTAVSTPGVDSGADDRAVNGPNYGPDYGPNYGGAPAQPWAGPFAAPNPGGQGGQGVPGGGFPPPYHTAQAGGPADAPGNPFAAPAHGGEHVPPPPIAPDGPGQLPYGYPGAHPGGYGYPAQPGYGGAHGPQAPGAPGYYGWPGMPPMANNGMGTAALVLGILSAIVFCLWPIAIIMGVLGVIFGAIGRKKANRGEATNGGQALAGLICGAVGIVLGIGMIVLLIVAP